MHGHYGKKVYSIGFSAIARIQWSIPLWSNQLDGKGSNIDASKNFSLRVKLNMAVCKLFSETNHIYQNC